MDNHILVGKIQTSKHGVKTMSRFSIGDVVRNTKTNEDGKIDKVIYDGNEPIAYSVHLPMDNLGWELGTRAIDVEWKIAEVIESPNEHLKKK